MCDCLVALPSATADGVTLFAKNSDRPSSELQRIARIEARIDHGPLRCTYIDVAAHPVATLAAIAMQPTWMWGVEGGVNEAGVAIGNEMIFTTLDPRAHPPALTGMDLVRLGLERAGSATEAVEVITGLLRRYGQGGSGHLDSNRPYWSSFLVADSTRAYVLETSGPSWAVEEVLDPGVRAISNRTTIAGFDAEHRHPRQRVAAFVDPRLRASNACLSQRPVRREAIEAHLRSHEGDGGWTVCMHVDEPGMCESTTASLIASLPAGHPPDIWLALGSPCQTEYVRQRTPGTHPMTGQ